ncbi:cytochrome P450 [Pradoshia sp.]
MLRGRKMPKERAIDQTLTLLSEGYNYLPNRTYRENVNIFQTRLLGQKVICITGEEAARAFYDEERFVRKQAVPKRIQKALFGEHGVQVLDDEEHKYRKAMFMSFMTHESLGRLEAITRREFRTAAQKWTKEQEIVLLEEAKIALCRIACEWAGVPLYEDEERERAQQLFDLVDSIGGVGPRYQRGRKARKQAEKWVADLIRQVRDGQLYPSEDTALFIMAHHTERDGELMEPEVAAVEVINIIRPTVAISYFIVFGALALHEHPSVRERLKEDAGAYSKMVVQEIRRYYPFAPMLGARVRTDFLWEGYAFKKGTLVLLDLYGTNHHPDLWEKPDEFNPERFKDWKKSPFDFIPQGGGDYDKGHRCAGEWATVKVMQIVMELLARELEYEVCEQDLTLSMVRIPTYPESGFRMRVLNLKPAEMIQTKGQHRNHAHK